MLHKIVGSTTAAPHIQIIFLRAYDLFGGGGGEGSRKCMPLVGEVT